MSEFPPDGASRAAGQDFGSPGPSASMTGSPARYDAQSPGSPQHPGPSWASAVSGPPGGGEFSRHPTGLCYCDPSVGLQGDTVGNVLKEKNVAVLWAGFVIKSGKASGPYRPKMRRGLVITAANVSLYAPPSVDLNRRVQIEDIRELYTQGSSLGLMVPSEYDLLLKFDTEDGVREVVNIIKTLNAYKRSLIDPNDSRPPLMETVKMRGQPIHKSLQLAKPDDWHSRIKGEKGMKKKTLPTRQKVARVHEVIRAQQVPPVEDDDEDLDEDADEANLDILDSPTVRVPSARGQTSNRSFRQSIMDERPAYEETPGDAAARAEMEAELEKRTLEAQQAHERAEILKLREARLEAQLADAKKKADAAQKHIGGLKERQEALDATNDQLKRENDHMARERERACEEFEIDPTGEVSLTEAARRLTSHHGSLSDANWRLTKQLAELEKKYQNLLAENKAGIEHARLRSDAEALKDLIDLRSAEMKTTDTQRQDGRTITHLSRQLHNEKQAHEETKLALFDLQQRHNSLSNRFKETTASSKGRIRSLEKKLQAILEGEAPEVVMGENRPRFSLSFSDTHSRPGSPRGVTAGHPYRGCGDEPQTPQDAPEGHNHHHHHHQPPADVGLGDKVVVSRLEGIVRGVVRYIGRLHGRAGEWIGVELEEPREEGHNGVYNKRQYFECPADRGLFVRPHNIAVENVACNTCETRRNMAALTKSSRGHSRSASPNRGVAPPAYRPPPSPSPNSEYVDLAVSLQEKLKETEDKLKKSEQLLNSSTTSANPPPPPPPPTEPASTTPLPAPPSPMPSSIASPPPVYRSAGPSATALQSTLTAPSTRRSRSRDRSASPSQPPPNPYEDAMRQALSTCVAQLDKKLPRAHVRPTAGDVRWAQSKSLADF
eukprot:TRINITY_DN3676_c0_g1_i1.p1 TRINITY_DN3676_c0_g1~~TRINITY_DN3676_c0_g1_i1.p1  ORF type:complete len:890 (+),score=212.10 TRINITY_DN3676_c0_g1_i1:58-2727(+)